MNDKINIKLVFGLYTKKNILYLYFYDNPISFCNIHFHTLSFEYYNNSSEITLWDKNNKIICSIDRKDINIFDNKIISYKIRINKFMKG